jgi:hypothetical protein
VIGLRKAKEIESTHDVAWKFEVGALALAKGDPTVHGGNGKHHALLRLVFHTYQWLPLGG